jgi:hypothetical protein
MECETLGKVAPSCFEPISVQGLPDYAKAYACLYELGQFLGIPWFWVDEDVISRVLRCRKQLSFQR